MSFNSHKSWHPQTKANINKLEKAQQKVQESSSIKDKILKLQEFTNSKVGPKGLDFMYQPPPGLFDKEPEEKPEDAIPDLPENKKARDFLKNAPSRGLWVPLGDQVKVMQCWRCKAYGHRTGDPECPLRLSGNDKLDSATKQREDPMAYYLSKKRKTDEDEDYDSKKDKKEKKDKKDKKDKKNKKEKKHKKSKKE